MLRSKQNRAVIGYFQHLIESGRFERIDHIFLTRGHTYLPNDRDFSSIETYKRKRTHVVLEDVIETVEKAREVKPFEVVLMKSEDFKDYKAWSDKKLRAQMKDQNGNNVSIRKLMWYSYGISEELDLETDSVVLLPHKHEVWAKHSYSDYEPWVKFNPYKRKANKAANDLTLKYPDGNVPLKLEKFNDLQKLVNKNIIPIEH